MAAISSEQHQRVELRPVWQVGLAVVCVAAAWGYDRPYEIVQVLYFLAVASIGIALLQRWPGVSRAASLVLLDSPAQRSILSWSRVGWPLTGLAGMIAAIVFLEVRQPYYFTQDDNLSQFLPGILQGCRSLANGVFPTWNPYQFMGSPSTTVGTYSLTYPPMWLSYWFAKHVLGREYATIEVFAVAHLLLAYGLIYWAVRREGVRPALAILASLCCVLSGYALLAGRSWYYVIPVFVWVPLLVICLQALRGQEIGWKWIVSCGVVIGVFSHAGNVQMWVYSMVFFVLAAALMLWTRAIPFRFLPALATSMLLGLALAAPLLVPQVLATQNVNRYQGDANILGGVPTLFVPVTLVQTGHPMNSGTFYKQYIGEMYYSGTVFCVAGAVLLGGLIVLRWRRTAIRQNVWFFCALVALILALGNIGLLWPLMQRLPGFNKFRLPYKFLELFNIFIAVAGACAWERFVRHRRGSFRAELALVAVVCALLAYHCSLALPSFCTFGFAPYPPVNPAIAQSLQSHYNRDYPKILPLGDSRSTEPDYLQSMQHQWPSLYGFFSVSGYDPLVSEDRTNIAINNKLFWEPGPWLYEYGVRYVLTYDTPWPKWLKVSATSVYRSDRFTLWELPQPRPMAWSDAEPARPLPVQFDGAGANLDTSQLPTGGWITLNMIRRPEISASTEKRVLPTMSDPWSRIRIQVPAGIKQIRVNFTPPWFVGFASAGLLMVLALIAARIHHHYCHSRDGRETQHLLTTLVHDAQLDQTKESLISSDVRF